VNTRVAQPGVHLVELLDGYGPLLLEHVYTQLETSNPQAAAFVKEYGNELLMGARGALLALEQNRKLQKAAFAAELGGRLLAGWSGEPTKDAARDAVDIAWALMQRAEELASK